MMVPSSVYHPMSPRCTDMMLVAVIVMLGLCGTAMSDKPKMLMFMLDGARWNYPDVQKYDGLSRMAEEGVRAEHVTPIFPAESYPNWYSLNSGLYAESHGITSNVMYSTEFGDYFNGAATNETRWWQGAEPLWVTAEKSGLKVAMHWWDGCQYEIRGVKPTFCRLYKVPVEMGETRAVLLESLDQLSSGEFNLVMIYCETIDLLGSRKGPDSAERLESFQQFDDMLLEALEKIDGTPELKDLNVVLVADHGMASMKDKKKAEWSRNVNKADILTQASSGTHTSIMPQEGREEALYQDIKNANISGVEVYKKDDIPEKYHIKNGQYTLPITVILQGGYSFWGPSDYGQHGWDPEGTPDMNGIFYAWGPAFKKGYKSPPIHIVDQYNVFCSILDIEALPNNGTWSKVQDMLVEA